MVNVSNEREPFDVLPNGQPSRPEAIVMNDDPEFPYVIKADVGRLSDGSMGLRLTVAESEEAYQAKAWTEVAYLLGPATARELATSLAWQ